MQMAKKGSVLGGILLITGSCVGAGMLGLPILTGLVGFFPSLFLFALSCFFMTATGLLIVELDQWFPGKTNYITMVTDLLGKGGRALCWVLYLFLFYALLVAYIAGSGIHFSSILGEFSLHVPAWLGSILFVLLFGWVVYLGTKAVDHFNRALMLFKIIAYLCLIGIGMQFVQFKLLEHVDLKYAVAALPILILSFGFQNMIPTLSDYLGGDVKRVKQSILGGALFTLLIYLFWQIIALGTLPIDGDMGILSSYRQGIDAAEAMKRLVASPWIGSFAAVLAFFAILTSFLAQTITLVHFMCDGFKIRSGKRENIWMCILALGLPLIFAITYPGIFYQALNFAGGICAVIIFGIFPVLMIWRGRYIFQRKFPYQVKGGKKLLVFIFSIAAFILFYQISVMFNLSIFPTVN